MNQSQILNEIINFAEKLGNSMTCIFDLDSTLFNVSPRMDRIIQEFAKSETMIALYPAQCRKMSTVKHQPKTWGILQSLADTGVDCSDQMFVEAIKEYWRNCFYKNEYLKCDEPFAGSVEFVNEIQQKGANISYLTGRDVPGMLDGTIESLNTWGFPLKEKNVNLALKPLPKDSDSDFKVDYISKLYKEEHPIYFFENEPFNLITAKEKFPKIKMIYFDSQHSGRAEPPKGVATITSFIR